MLSVTEILFIVFVLLIIFGASRLPQVGTSLGKGIFNFKRAVKGQVDIDVTPVKKEEIPPAPPKA